MVLSSNILDIKKLSQQILYECWTKGLDEAILKDNFFPFTRVYLKATHFKALYCGYFLIPLFVVEKDILKYRFRSDLRHNLITYSFWFKDDPRWLTYNQTKDCIFTDLFTSSLSSGICFVHQLMLNRWFLNKRINKWYFEHKLDFQ